jgi:hypothetical protein
MKESADDVAVTSLTTAENCHKQACQVFREIRQFMTKLAY